MSAAEVLRWAFISVALATGFWMGVGMQPADKAIDSTTDSMEELKDAPLMDSPATGRIVDSTIDSIETGWSLLKTGTIAVGIVVAVIAGGVTGLVAFALFFISGYLLGSQISLTTAGITLTIAGPLGAIVIGRNSREKSRPEPIRY